MSKEKVVEWEQAYHSLLKEFNDLKAQYDQLKEMTSFISHEIRNPLGGVLGYAALLNEELEEGSDTQEKVKKMIKGLNHLQEILHRFEKGEYYDDRKGVGC